MIELYKRDWLVRVHNLEVSGLDCSWDVVKSVKREPNTCSLRVFNLTRGQRAELSALNLKPAKAGIQAGKIRVEIEAGYETTGRSLRFRGDLRTCIHERVGSDWQTTIEGEDGGRSVLLGRIVHSFPAGTTYAAAIAQCARAMGLGIGNLAEVTGALTRTFVNGASFHGAASVLLAQLVRALGVTYSIQNGVLLFQRAGTALTGKAVLLTAATGLIGAPQRDASGVVKVRSLLIPDLVPGARVLLGEGDFKGLYKITRTADTCETYGQPWYVDCELAA